MTEIKYIAIMFAAFAIAGCIAVAFESYANAIEARAAMENGYEQVREQGGPTLWKKVEPAQ